MIRRTATTWIACVTALTCTLVGCDGPPPQPVPASAPATAASTPTSAPAPIPVTLNFSFESFPGLPPDDATVRVSFKDKIHPLPGLPPEFDFAVGLEAGEHTVDLSALPEGKYNLWFHADDYADQWCPVTIAGGVATMKPTKFTLYRKRYVTLLYAINPDSTSTDLSPAAAKPTRMVIEHMGRVMPFNMNWQLWQGQTGRGYDKLFSAEPRIMFSQNGPANGFMVDPDGKSFDAIVAAPSDSKLYRCDDVLIKPGVTLICNISLKGKHSAYGKILVEAVSLTKPNIKQPE